MQFLKGLADKVEAQLHTAAMDALESGDTTLADAMGLSAKDNLRTDIASDKSAQILLTEESTCGADSKTTQKEGNNEIQAKYAVEKGFKTVEDQQEYLNFLMGDATGHPVDHMKTTSHEEPLIEEEAPLACEHSQRLSNEQVGNQVDETKGICEANEGPRSDRVQFECEPEVPCSGRKKSEEQVLTSIEANLPAPETQESSTAQFPREIKAVIESKDEEKSDGNVMAENTRSKGSILSSFIPNAAAGGFWTGGKSKTLASNTPDDVAMRVGDKNIEVDDRLKEIQKLTAEIKSLRRRNAELEAESTELYGDGIRYSELAAKAETKYNESQKVQKTMRAKIQSLEESLSATQRQLTEMEKKCVVAGAETDRIRDLERELNSLSDRLVARQSECNSLRSKYDNVSKQFKELRVRLVEAENLAERVPKLLEDHGKLTAELHDRREECEKAWHALSESEKQTREVQERNLDEISRLKQQIGKMKEAFEHENAQRTLKLTALQSDNDNLRKSLAAIQKERIENRFDLEEELRLSREEVTKLNDQLIKTKSVFLKEAAEVAANHAKAIKSLEDTILTLKHSLIEQNAQRFPSEIGRLETTSMQDPGGRSSPSSESMPKSGPTPSNLTMKVEVKMRTDMSNEPDRPSFIEDFLPDESSGQGGASQDQAEFQRRLRKSEREAGLFKDEVMQLMEQIEQERFHNSELKDQIRMLYMACEQSGADLTKIF